MTKAERIYEATKREIMHGIRMGWRCDCLNHLIVGENEIVCQRTVNALRKLAIAEMERLQRIESRYERRPEDAEAYEYLLFDFQRKVEMARRMWLTIGTAQRDIDFLKSI